MKHFSLLKAAEVMQGRLITGNKEQEFHNAAGFSFQFAQLADEEQKMEQVRQLRKSCLIVPASQDLVWEKWSNAGINIIQVASMGRAYLSFVKFYRSLFNIPVIQIVGSSGKTTTKEMIGQVLKKKLKPLVGRENFNTPFSAFANILRVDERHKAMVIETGMKAPGIIGKSSRILRPQIGVLTSLQAAHLLRLGSMEKIIEAKAEILPYLAKNGVFLINGDDENCRKFPLARYQGEIIRYGLGPENDIQALEIRSEGDTTFFTAKWDDLYIPCTINTFGRFNVCNALAAVMVGLKLGITPQDIAKGLAKFRPVHSRLKVHQLRDGITLIDDNFNANPESVSMVLEEVPRFAQGRPLVIVLGDMERPDDNIAEYARRVHYAIGQKLAQIEFHHLLAVGKWAEEYVRGALSEGKEPERMDHFPTVDEAVKAFVSFVPPGSVVLLKASATYLDLRKCRQWLG